MTKYLVDIPSNVGLREAWKECAEFDTRAEAVEYVRDFFGGVDGKIDLITELPDEEPD